MATVWLSPSDTVHLPGLCVKTGRPTTHRQGFEAAEGPAGSGVVLLLGGFWVWVIFRAFATDVVTLTLPVTAAATWRHRKAELASAGGVVIGLVVMVAAVAVPSAAGAVILAGAAVVVIALAAGAVTYPATWVRVSFNRADRAVIVRGCHPDFVEAVRASRAVNAGP